MKNYTKNSRICPFCDKKLNGGSSHAYRCKELPLNIDKKDIKYLYIKKNFPEISEKNILINEYEENKMSLPEIKEKYLIDFKSTLWLLEYYNINIRKMKESNLLGAKKTKKTLNILYGGLIDNVSQLDSVKKKKENTFIKNYGVDNIRKWKPFQDYIRKMIEEKQGISLEEFRSIKGKNYWKKLSDKDKKEWLDKSIHNNSAIEKRSSNKKGYVISKLENRIEKVLKKINLEYIPQFLLFSNNKYYSYDFFLSEYNIILEINGDYWHANPEIYEKEDLIKYPGGNKKASYVWEKDKEKKEFAEKKGIPVFYIWEKEINEKFTDEEILNLIEIKINEKINKN